MFSDMGDDRKHMVRRFGEVPNSYVDLLWGPSKVNARHRTAATGVVMTSNGDGDRTRSILICSREFQFEIS